MLVVMNNKTKALIQVNSAILIFSLAVLSGKLIPMAAPLLILCRSFIAVITLGIILKAKKHKILLDSKKDLLSLILFGVLLSGHWVLLFYSMQVSTVAISLICFFTYPIFASLLEPLFIKEKYKFTDLILAIIVLIGIIFVVPNIDLRDNMFIGVISGLASALLIAIRNIFCRKFSSKYSGSIIMFYQLIVVTFILAPTFFMWDISLKINETIYLLAFGTIGTALAHTLLISSLAHLKATTTGIISSWQPVLSISFAALLLKEIPSIKTITGGMIILSAVIIETLRQGKATQ